MTATSHHITALYNPLLHGSFKVVPASMASCASAEVVKTLVACHKQKWRLESLHVWDRNHSYHCLSNYQSLVAQHPHHHHLPNMSSQF